MTLRQVTIDQAVWLRDTYYIDIPDGTPGEDIEEFIDDAINNDKAQLVEGSEDIGSVIGMDRQYAVDGEDI